MLTLKYRLIEATPEGEVSMDLLQAAARDHIPVNPSAKKALAATSVGDSKNMTIPDPEDRDSIDDIILELKEQEWYQNQIVDRRTFEAKKSIEGSEVLHGYFFFLTYCNEVYWMNLFQIPYNKHYESRETYRHYIIIKQPPLTLLHRRSMSLFRLVLHQARV
jgi:hypothetical protein